MSSRTKNILKKIALGLMVGFTIFSVVHVPEARAALDQESIYQFAYCGGLHETGDDEDSIMRFGIPCYISQGLQLIVIGVLYSIGALFGILLSTFVTVSLWMINLGIRLINDLTAIGVGFEMSLGLANLMFIVAVILIAFATILRWHEYEAKKMLPRLIFATLLVNFSFLIAGLFLDVSNVFTNYFMGHFDSINIGKTLDPAVALGNKAEIGSIGEDGKPLIKAKRFEIGGGKHSWEDFMVILPQMIFSIIITFVMMMAMIAVFIMALIRNIWVVVLLITMPLAWGSWVVPKLEGYWKKWWENFINWGVLYLPIVTFFLFLAFRTLDIKAKGTLTPPVPVGTEGTFGAAINVAITNAVSSLIAIGLVLAGLKIAQSMGSQVAGTFASLAGRGSRKLAGGLLKTSGLAAVAGTGLAIGAAKGGLREFGRGGSGSLLGAAKGAFKGAVGGFGAGAQAPGIAARASAGWTAKALGIMNWVPGLGALTNPLAAKLSAAANSQTGLEDIQKRWKGLQGKALDSALVNTMSGWGTPQEKAAALAYMAKNHKLSLLDSKEGKYNDAILAASATLKELAPNIAPRKNVSLKAIAGHFSELAPQITGELPAQARRRQTAADMRAHDAEHVAHGIDNYTAAQLIANASASGKNQNIIKATLAQLIAGSKAFEGDSEMKAAAEQLGKIADKLEEKKDDVSVKGIADRTTLSNTHDELLIKVSGKIDGMKAEQAAKLEPLDHERLEKWNRLKRTHSSAEPADHADHAEDGETVFGEVGTSIVGDALGRGGNKKSSGGGGGGGKGHHPG